MNELNYLQMHLARGIGPITMRRLLTQLSQKNIPLEEFLRLPVKEQITQFNLTSKQVQSLQDTQAIVEKTYNELRQHHITLLSLTNPKYPTRLRERLGDKLPPLFYTWGNLDLLNGKAIGFCGARDVSDQGVSVAKDCVEQIVKWGWQVVSGGARGVDTTVHHTALAAGGNTVIVLPEGILRYRLRSVLKPLITKENTLLISEFPPYMGWSVGNAMQRNRTICGLSNALIVVESGTSGGTFEAGKLALRLKIPLFVADYAKPASVAAGNAYFLKRGAYAIRRSIKTKRANLDNLQQIVESHLERELAAIQGQLF